MKQTGGETTHLSIRSCDQLFEIKEQIDAVTDAIGGSSSDRVLVTTIAHEICRSLFNHIGSFKFQASRAVLNDRQALQIRIQLYKSDVLRLQQENITMAEVLALDISTLQSVFDEVDAKILADKEYSISLTRYWPGNK